MSREEELRPYAHRQEISLLFSRKNIWQYRDGLCISSMHLAELVFLSGLTLAAHVRLCIEIYIYIYMCVCVCVVLLLDQNFPTVVHFTVSTYEGTDNRKAVRRDG